MEVVNFVYNDQQIDFEPTGKDDVMVNATQMAKIFGKHTKDFLKNEDIKLFIDECLKEENSPHLSIKSQEDLITSKRRTGTYMHRVLALRFAAWLDPKFSLWVFITIDKILNEYYREQRDRKVLREKLKSTIKQKKEAYLLKSNPDPDYLEILNLEHEFREIDSVSKSENRKEIRNIQLMLSFS